MSFDNGQTPIITVSPDAGNEGFYRIMDLGKDEIMWGWKMRDGTVIHGTYIENGSMGPLEYIVIDAYSGDSDLPIRITVPTYWVQAVEYI